MEQTKNEPKNENKAAPDNGKPKKERKPINTGCTNHAIVNVAAPMIPENMML